MPGRQAKTLVPSMQKRLLRHLDKSNNPERSRLIVLLALKAGLRACEIARLEWSMVLDPKGRVATTIELHDRIAARPNISAYLSSERRIPFNEDGIFRHYKELDT